MIFLVSSEQAALDDLNCLFRVALHIAQGGFGLLEGILLAGAGDGSVQAPGCFQGVFHSRQVAHYQRDLTGGQQVIVHP